MKRVGESKGVVAGVQSAAEYRQRTRDFRAKHQSQPSGERLVSGGVGVLEADGFVRLKCVCGNWPLVDPVWRLACCFRCGRVYESVALLTETS